MALKPAIDHVVILSRNPRIYETRRLAEVAREQGFSVEIVDHVEIKANARAYAGDHEITPGIVIPRVGYMSRVLGIISVRRMEQLGWPMLASADALAIARDKIKAEQRLAEKGLPQPKTVTGPVSESDLLSLGTQGWVVKKSHGAHGNGVELFHDLEATLRRTAVLEAEGSSYLVQTFIPEAISRDKRLFVIGDHVVAAMQRTGPAGDFRSNLGVGGTAEAYHPTAEEVDIACSAAAALELSIAGVDLIDSHSGPLVLEVNPCPGFEGLEKATGVSVAEAIVSFVAHKI